VEYAARIILSTIPVGLFFALYFRNFVFQRSILWQSKTFFLGMLSSIAAIVIQAFLPETASPAIRSFFHAALVEEAIRFTVLYLRIRKSSEGFTVTEGIFDGILVALGFAFSENLHYSATTSGYVILLRCISSVPLHVFCGGIMAYFLSYRSLCRENRKVWRRLNWYGLRRFELAVFALLIPFLLHGFFDYALFRGDVWNYMLVPILVTGFIVTEYMAARGMQIFGKNILGALGLDADDMEIIGRQQEYEKWLSDYQDEDREAVEIFRNRWEITPTALGILFFLIAAAFFIIRFRFPSWLSGSGIDAHAQIALTVVLPAFAAAVLLLRDKINYLYFRETMLRVPSGTLVHIEHERGTSQDTMIFDILPGGAFLSGVDDLSQGDRLHLSISRNNKPSLRVRCAVRWVNNVNRQRIS
jgi:RsiW-degrading membrane proteinase PrsW (M82 family)